MVLWSMVEAEFEPDGELRDVYVFGADRSTWERALAFLLSKGTTRFEVDGVVNGVPGSASEALAMRPASSPLLLVTRDGIEFACHFFDETAIELDFWPEDVGCAEEFDSLVELVSGLSRSTGRDVVVTHENRPEAEIVRFLAESGELVTAGDPSRRTR